MNKYILPLLFLGILSACDHPEDEALPGFLDGTQYGVAFTVAHLTDDILKLGENDAVEIELIVKGADQRPVELIEIFKQYVQGETALDKVSIGDVSSFPDQMSLDLSSLVDGYESLSVDSLQAGDVFKISFEILYQDGARVTKFGTRINPNFDIIVE